MSRTFDLVSPLVVLVVIALSGLNTFGQCGVYFKRTSTWSFPVSRVHLDRAHDMTGDGLLDLLVSEEGPGWTRSRIFILPNLGNGSFGPPWATLMPPASTVFNFQYFVAHVNNDTRPDLLMMMNDTSLPNSFLAMINNGDGTFSPGTYMSAVGSSSKMVDINNDGFGDYLGLSSSTFRYSLGNGDGTFAPPVALFSNDGSPTPGDFNGDGKMDFVDTRHLHLNNGDLTFGTTDIQSITNGTPPSSLADYNLDGKLDILGGTTPGHTGFSILYSTGTTFTRTDVPVSGDSSWNGIAIVGDWGGSSAPDLAFQSTTLNKYAIFINDGTGNFTRSDYKGRLDIPSEQKYVRADFDNDGKLDILQATSNISNSKLMFRDVTSFSLLKQVCDLPGQPRIVDYDLSRTTDWSIWDPSTGDWSIRTRPLQFGPNVINETVNWGLGSLGDIPTPGDFDGDAITDRAVYRDSTGYWYIRRSSDLAWFVIRFGLPGDKPVAGDYDGDTISDIAVWRPSDGNWYVWLMGPQQFWAVHFGSNGDKPVPADFDGDLKTDVAVFRPSTGVWYYLRSSDLNAVVFQWGISTDRPIPADFDGDGKADISIHRASDNVAYILRSSNLTPSYYQFGIAGDILQVGDYDGDYVADIGMYRPSNNTWWLTTFPFAVAQNFGSPGVVPTSSLIRVE